MNKNKNYFSVVPSAVFILITFLMISCGKKSEMQNQPPPKIPVIKAERKNVPVYKEFVGQIYGFQDIAIRARVEGFLEAIHFKEGTRVKKDQLLYTIDPQQFQAKVGAQMSMVAEAKTMLAKAESDLNRIRPLAENNAVSQSDLDAAVAQFDAAQASLEAAKSNLKFAEIQLSYTRIKSPIDGIIGKTQAKVGDFVGRSPNPVVLNEVSNIEKVLVEFFLSEAEYLTLAREMLEETGRISRNKEAGEGKISMKLADGTIYDQMGYVTFLDRGVNPSTGTILIQAEFLNPDRILRPGQFARVIVEMANINNALLVPQSAVNEVQGEFSVFVVNDSSSVDIRPVAILDQYKDYYIVNEGLKGNEQIVIQGLQKVRSGMTVVPEMTTYISKQDNTD